MCGLTGFASLEARDAPSMTALVRRMSARLRHRGPDDDGEWVDAASGVALGHRRLAIVDLSAQGHQPMVSHTGRYVLAYNGEIYNHALLRAELDASGPTVPWRGLSDTETVLAVIERWGLDVALPRLNGMFAFVLWDRQTRRLHLARDRFGEKPLYYAHLKGAFLFASELKAFSPHPAWSPEIDRGALRAYMRYNYIPAPFTIFSAARKLPAGSVLTVAVDGVKGALGVGDARCYWSAIEVALAARQRPLQDRAQAREELRELFSRVVSSRLMSDVPLGAFLSGGIDSSLVVAMMAQKSRHPVRTFTIGFDDPAYDESAHAAEVAQCLGTAHRCDRVTPAEAREAIMQMPTIYDEPFADSSQIPTYLVSRTARKAVTVALTGDGGDELFAGYDRYFVGQRAFPVIRSVPGFVRRPLAATIRMLAPGSWQSLLDGVRRVGRAGWLADLSGERLHRLAQQLHASTEVQMYEIMMSRPEDGTVSLHGCEEREPVHGGAHGWPASLPYAESMMLFDTLNILADDFLVKVDRASMSVGLETRAPFLDPELFEFAWRMPLAWRINAHTGKLILREVLHEFVPQAITERPKQGFGIPVGAWVKGPLRDWAEALLDEHRLRQEGFLAPAPIRRKWAEHLAGTHDRQNEIWCAIVFQEWLANMHENRAPAVNTMAQPLASRA